MGCGSSRPKVGQAEEQADECNTNLAVHLASIFGIKPTSTDVTRYVLALRSEGFDAPEDLHDLTVETLAAKPFSFKQGHLLKITRSRNKEVEKEEARSHSDAFATPNVPSALRVPINEQVDDDCNAALATHLASILGIKPTSIDIGRYVESLRSEGYDDPDDIYDLCVEDLVRKPFDFKSMHAKKVRTASTCACALPRGKCVRVVLVCNLFDI